MTKRKSEPRLFFKTTDNRKNRDEIKRLNAQGVGPLSIAVRLKLNARFVLEVIEKNKTNKSYEPQSWSLNDNFF